MVIVHLTGRIAKYKAIQAIQDAPEGYVCRISEKVRNLEQNSKLWACLTDIANQVIWHGVRLTNDEWKDVLTASLKRSRVVPGLDGGFVVLGQHTSKMTKAEFSELIELAMAFGAEHDVVWSDMALPIASAVHKSA